MTRTQFEEELERIRTELLEMTNYADRMVGNAMQALIDRDLNRAVEVIEADDELDALDIEVETSCMRLLALQQPLARDLRLIGTALKIITDVERIGDHAVDIAKIARKLIRAEVISAPMVDLPKMASEVRRMLNDALAAFVSHSMELVDSVIAADDVVDELFHRIRSDLHNVMQTKPQDAVQASYLLFVAHYLERIADHAVNISERVAYIETAQLMQHARLKRLAE